MVTQNTMDRSKILHKSFTRTSNGHWDTTYVLTKPINKQRNCIPLNIELLIESMYPLGTYGKFDHNYFIEGLRQTIEDYCNNYKY